MKLELQTPKLGRINHEKKIPNWEKNFSQLGDNYCSVRAFKF